MWVTQSLRESHAIPRHSRPQIPLAVPNPRRIDFRLVALAPALACQLLLPRRPFQPRGQMALLLLCAVSQAHHLVAPPGTPRAL
jgi:hypothetical protein